MRSYGSATLIFISVCLSGSTPTGAQSSSYRAFVEAYREPGTSDMSAVLAMSRAAVVAAVDEAVSGATSWRWEELRAAAMLHSEACVAAVNNADGDTCEFHITQAQRLLERTVALAPREEDFEWRWFLVMPRILSEMKLNALARRLTTEADAKWHHDSARAAYVRGLELEARGLREGIVAPITGPPLSLGIPTQASYFVPAGAAFARALKEKPELAAAALHLGRIQMLQERRAEAAELFRSALESPDPSVSYLSALFLGSIEEHDEHFVVAESLYRKAMKRVPFSQSAPLALAELLSRTGREVEARQTLSARVLRINSESLEPFWAYGGPDQALATSFDLLRFEVWK